MRKRRTAGWPASTNKSARLVASAPVAIARTRLIDAADGAALAAANAFDSGTYQVEGISDAVRDAAELMGKGYEEIKAAAAKDPRSVAAAAKHRADATANVPTHHLPKASHGAHMG